MATGDQFADDVKNFGVNRVGKMFRAQKFRDFFKSFIVGQKCSEQSLLGFNIFRQLFGLDFHGGESLYQLFLPTL